jgi:hypothetical protein
MITPSGIKKALIKRAAKKAYKPKPIELDPTFPAQNAMVLDKNRFIVAQCGRRSGKTNGLAIRFFNTLAKYPGSQCIYLSLTFDSARDILWPVLQELDKKYDLNCEFIESKLWMKHPNGSILKLMGADMKNFIKRLKGRKSPGIAIDEAQDFGVHLQSLVDDVLTPMTADYTDGWLALTGTPGPVPQGYFFQITKERKYGYSYHAWTILNNIYMPSPQAFLDEIKNKREWDNLNPTYLREYCNEWVLDVKSLWINYKESINHYQFLPLLPSNAKWHYIVGVDLGYKDADAIAVIAWSEHTPTTYLVEELVTPKQGITELVRQVEGMITKYSPDKIVMDEGALGKKIGEEMRRQHRIPVQGADKLRKQENVEFLNDALRTGRFMAKSTSRFATDSYVVMIDWDKSTPDRIIVKKNPHSDIIDAVLYSFKESPAFTFQKAKVPPKWGTKEYADAQEDHMWQAELEGLQEEAERLRTENSFGWDD